MVPILGSIGSHWVQKYPRSSISTKIRLYGQHRKKLPYKFEFSTTPRSSISTKIRLYGYGAKSRCRPPRVHFVANGVPLGPKMGHYRKKLPCPQIRIFDYPAVIDFDQNSTLRLWHKITGADHLGSTLWPMGSHWVQ